MNLIYANPLTLVFHYLTLFIYGTPLDELQTIFSTEDKKYAAIGPEASGTGDQAPIYDFIIVGRGSSGSTLSNLLSAENYSVLLLEAGGNQFPLTAVPSFPFVNLGHPNSDWVDKVVPQERACHALKDNGTFFNRGKMLGGSSALNFMLYMRGNPNDFDNWAQETNDPSWSYASVLPFFRDLENYNGGWPLDDVHGKGGPLNVDRPSYSPLREEWLQSDRDLGYEIKDPNGYQSESFFPFELTTKESTRCSTQRAYIYPALMRKNLKIQIYSMVTKIELDKDNRAIGVKYENGGVEYFARTKKEVILSAGALGSPQLLMWSGIGPKAHLESVGITSRVDLPAVGQNLQDHVSSFIGPFIVENEGVANIGRDLSLETLHEYIQQGTGPFSYVDVGGGAMVSSSLTKPGWPDLYYTMLGARLSPVISAVFEKVFDFRPNVLQKYFEPDYGKYVIFMVFTLGLTKTRGEVKLKSKDTKEKLHIDPKYFEHPDDAQAMLEGMRFSMKLVNESKTMQKFGLRFTKSIFPGCESFPDNQSDDYLKCYFRHWTHTLWHYTSTAKMGKGPEDQNSVVDSQLRVHGVTGLRVIDNSIMPKVTNANLNLPAIMIGNKGAAMIKTMWQNK